MTAHRSARTHGAKNQLGLGLSSLEDRPADGLLQDLFRLPAAIGQSCNTTVRPGPASYSSCAAEKGSGTVPVPESREPGRGLIRTACYWTSVST